MTQRRRRSGGPQRPSTGLLLLLCLMAFTPDRSIAQERSTNSIGMEFVQVERGSFQMGALNRIPSRYLDLEDTEEDIEYLRRGDWDEHPVHEVVISQPFRISTTEVTIEQFRQFRPGYEGSAEYAPYATGVSWYDAMAFCEWLSEKEDKPYRLPTEAEWEYAARAGTTTLFWSGDTLPVPGAPNPWGLKNMHTGPPEWTLDWHGRYPHEKRVDPVGPAHGFAKVVRGGGLDRHDPYYARAANRAGIAPDFPPILPKQMRSLIAASRPPGRGGSESPKESASPRNAPQGFQAEDEYESFWRSVQNNQGNHPIGFRVIQAPMPDAQPYLRHVPFTQQVVKQTTEYASYGPDPEAPYFRKRYLLPKPPENTPVDQIGAIRATGLDPGILSHNHSPSLVLCPNGDLLAVYYTAVSELSPDVAILASRLRFGSDQWDMPRLFMDFPDVDDHAPLLWNDGGTLRFFWGANQLESGFPFQWTSSVDNGATWSEVRFPVFETPVGSHSAQPINSALRDSLGTLYVSSDGEGAESVLWVSYNNGQTWVDPGGRTGGRHTTFALLEDGRILGMGGKSSDINGYMPKSISNDGGQTWHISQTPFASLGSNQRPTLLRLESGRLFFAGDFQRSDGFQPEGIGRRGAYVALSEDGGQTWHIKKLPGTHPHEDEDKREAMHGAGTLGYAVARQTPNGVIHLITSMNDQALHFAMNEAWILQPADEDPSGDDLMEPAATTIEQVQTYRKTYPNGQTKVVRRAGIADNGRYLLHGTESWYYKNGQKQWEATYEMGQKVGAEVYWAKDGQKLWSWEHREDGTHIWTHYWSNGQKKAESTWRDFKAIGVATRWDPSGRVVLQATFEDGVPTQVSRYASR